MLSGKQVGGFNIRKRSWEWRTSNFHQCFHPKITTLHVIYHLCSITWGIHECNCCLDYFNF
ncbi:hypothetical protein D0Y65_047895 [Glycine soja]|uniref:Uncharacterized protein n=1 Tax=Glycine soja TaxID=3848 RepID=A0A445FQU0_GLYSO|nr:hypothetical protein D0Y65_047895 [Glycine soja]